MKFVNYFLLKKKYTYQRFELYYNWYMSTATYFVWHTILLCLQICLLYATNIFLKIFSHSKNVTIIFIFKINAIFQEN